MTTWWPALEFTGRLLLGGAFGMLIGWSLAKAIRWWRRRRLARYAAQVQSQMGSLRESAEAMIELGRFAIEETEPASLEALFTLHTALHREDMPARVLAPAYGLLLCQLEEIERRPEKREHIMAAMRGGMFGLILAGMIYESERPMPAQKERV